MPRRAYSSDLTDAQWVCLEPRLPAAPPGGRPRPHPLREIVDAILNVLWGGIAWRALPLEYPPWQTVYHYFQMWRLDEIWDRLSDELRTLVREQAGRNAQPSTANLDSQSTKTTEKGCRVNTTAPRRSMAANGMSWWIPMDCC